MTAANCKLLLVGLDDNLLVASRVSVEKFFIVLLKLI
jgi:hypothetical protein